MPVLQSCLFCVSQKKKPNKQTTKKNHPKTPTNKQTGSETTGCVSKVWLTQVWVGEGPWIFGEDSSQGNKKFKKNQDGNKMRGGFFFRPFRVKGFWCQSFPCPVITGNACKKFPPTQNISLHCKRISFFPPSPFIHHLQPTAAIYQCQFNSLTQKQEKQLETCLFSISERHLPALNYHDPPAPPQAKRSSSSAAALLNPRPRIPPRRLWCRWRALPTLLQPALPGAPWVMQRVWINTLRSALLSKACHFHWRQVVHQSM